MKYITQLAFVLAILSTAGCRKKDRPKEATGPAPLEVTRLLTFIYKDNVLYERLDYNNKQLTTWHHFDPTTEVNNIRLEFKTDTNGKLIGTLLYQKDGTGFKLIEKNEVQSLEKEFKITGNLYRLSSGTPDTIPDAMRFAFDDNGRMIELTDTLTTEKKTDYLSQLIVITTCNYSGDQLNNLTRKAYNYYVSPTLPGGEKINLYHTGIFQYEYDDTPNFFYALGKRYPYLRFIMTPEHPLFAGRTNVKKITYPGGQTEIIHLFQDTHDDHDNHIIYTTEVTLNNGVTNSTTHWQYHYILLP
ncbi:hypothetical protein [Chitinophaga sp. ARDCPP14]|uniref:hypothetical protein n=1 Tax=Chitinophaga sp. ARDCPP14 TaxID=3391139 RepID=UPI003F51FB87